MAVRKHGKMNKGLVFCKVLQNFAGTNLTLTGVEGQPQKICASQLWERPFPRNSKRELGMGARLSYVQCPLGYCKAVPLLSRSAWNKSTTLCWVIKSPASQIPNVKDGWPKNSGSQTKGSFSTQLPQKEERMMFHRSCAFNTLTSENGKGFPPQLLFWDLSLNDNGDR